jgi:hypothetical protein
MADVIEIINGILDIKGGTATVLMGPTNIFDPNVPPLITPTLNISDGAVVDVGVLVRSSGTTDATINVRNSDTLNLTISLSNHFNQQASTHVNLDHAVLQGTINNFGGGDIIIDGTGKVNTSSISMALGSKITILPDMIGTGSNSLRFTTAELGGSVGPDQTFSLAGSQLTIDHNFLGTIDFSFMGSKLIVDQPDNFHGKINGMPSNEIDLLGIDADAYSFKDDLLTLYSGNKPVDTLRLHTTAAAGATPVTVSHAPAGSSGIVIGLVNLPPGVPGGDIPLKS